MTAENGAPDPVQQPPYDRQESEFERLDRNMAELLQELRVAQTGVQFLFAFLLILSFQEKFASLDGFGRAIYLGALGCALFSAGFLIAPVGYHRLVFRRRMKAELVAVAHRMALGGLASLALALGLSLTLILDMMYGRVEAIVVGSIATGWLFLLWFLLPWLRVRAMQKPRG